MQTTSKLKAQIRAINKKITENTFKSEKALYKAKNKVKTLKKELREQLEIQEDLFYWENFLSI